MAKKYHFIPRFGVSVLANDSTEALLIFNKDETKLKEYREKMKFDLNNDKKFDDKDLKLAGQTLQKGKDLKSK